MKKRIRTLVLLAFAAAVVLIFSGIGTEQSRGIFYRITGGKNDLYLLGSIHIGSRDMYPFGKHIRQALEDAETLIFECDTQSAESASAMQKWMIYSDGKTIADELSPETAALLDQTAEKLGSPLSMLEDIKPWAITSMFSMHTTATEMGVKSIERASAYGVEEVIRKEAGEKRIIYLETVDEQLQMLDSFSPSLQEYLLASACQTILDEIQDEDLKLWPKWWKEGQAEAFAQSYLTGLEKESKPALAQEYHEAMITTRNHKMADLLSQIMESDEHGDCFAVVGLMHLVLPQDSIVEMLEQRGYQTERFF